MSVQSLLYRVRSVVPIVEDAAQLRTEQILFFFRKRQPRQHRNVFDLSFVIFMTAGYIFSRFANRTASLFTPKFGKLTMTFMIVSVTVTVPHDAYTPGRVFYPASGRIQDKSVGLEPSF